MIQKQMQLDGPFGPSEMSPVEHRETHVDRRGIHADQLVLKSEFLLAHPLRTTSIEELEEDLLIKLPGAVFIGVGQGGVGRSSDSQMFQLALAASESPGNLTKGMSAAQLTE